MKFLSRLARRRVLGFPLRLYWRIRLRDIHAEGDSLPPENVDGPR